MLAKSTKPDSSRMGLEEGMSTFVGSEELKGLWEEMVRARNGTDRRVG